MLQRGTPKLGKDGKSMKDKRGNSSYGSTDIQVAFRGYQRCADWTQAQRCRYSFSICLSV